MAGSGPGYLKRVVVRRVGIGRADLEAAVVLRAGEGRPAEVPADLEMRLGRVVPQARSELNCASRARAVSSWTFVCEGYGEGGRGGGWYRSRREAAESCAVEAIDGPAARRRFDFERWERWRPSEG